MTKDIFVLTAALFWISFLARFVLWTRPNRRLETTASGIEKFAVLAFTTALVLYIERLQVVNGEVQSSVYDRPVSFLLFAWAVAAAHLITEVAYDNKLTAIFADFWAAFTLTISSSAAKQLKGIFSNDLEWLGFHRICFLLGYGFCVLAFPLMLRYFQIAFSHKGATEEAETARLRELSRLDRMCYRMVLWALPALSAGIIAEGIVLLDLRRLLSPVQLWTQQQENLLALTAWFLCGLYLHMRLFFGWRHLRSAGLYLGGLFLLVATHLSQIYAHALPH
jgi:Cytochrome C assembly protein